MRLRGTIWVYPKGCEPGQIPTMLTFVKELDAPSIPHFRQQVLATYPNPDVAVEFGPIGPPWNYNGRTPHA